MGMPCYYCYFGQIVMQINKQLIENTLSGQLLPGVQNSTNCSQLVERDLKVISVYKCV